MRRMTRDVRELATILGRIVITSGIWYNHTLVIHKRRHRRMRYIVGGLGLLMVPFLLPIVALAALVLTVSATLKANTGDIDDA